MPGGAGKTRAWLKRARAAGCRVEKRPNLGGEILVEGPDGMRIRIHAGRKDAPRCLLTLVRRAERGR